MAEGHDNEACGKCIWTRVQVAYDTLTAKDRFECNDMNSNRDRLGVRCSCKEAERFCPFAGASFEHEFSGLCESTGYSLHVAVQSFDGSSGIEEPALMMKASENLPLSFNSGVQGYFAQKPCIFDSCIASRGCKACVPIHCI